MSATPRLRSGYPSTPATAAPKRNLQETPDSARSVSSLGASSTKSPTLPLAPENVAKQQTGNAPVIPLTLLDAPQQRFYAFGIYVALWGWKLYDWLQVVEEGDTSWFLFLKWILIDFAFLFGLPELRIPWLELSQLLVTSVFTSHLVINYMLMFNIPLPWQSWMIALAKVLYDRELSISEQNVKVANILNNHSLIMGKQIINILPEGAAVLNPEHIPFCIDSKSKTSAALPIYFNSTVPAEIELIRIDLETSKEETIKVSSRDLGKVAKSIREHSSDPTAASFHWDYPVKKPGVYRLGKVLDEYKLEVQRSTKDTYVVPCPQVKIPPPDSRPRCIRELSNISLEVVGTPPLKIVYSRTINDKNHSFHIQSLQPDGFMSPLIGSFGGTMEDSNDDVSWVRPATVTVGLNESMNSAGIWEYSVDEVHDAFGNVMQYAQPSDDPETPGPKAMAQRFEVQERPKVRMQGCDIRNALKVAKGKKASLPVTFGLPGAKSGANYQVTWNFSPIDTLTNSGDHGSQVSVGSYSAKNSQDRPSVSEPGLYTLKSVTSGACQGDVDEPSSCLLLNPLQPHLSIRSDEIPDKCAGNSIGLRVDLDLVGTPPFTVNYDVITNDSQERHRHRVDGLRSQLELIPRVSGKHKYVFKSISDGVYNDLPLNGDDKVLEQEVKPAAQAFFAAPSRDKSTCLDSSVELDVVMNGEPPFNLEWEVVHDGKRKTEKATNLESREYKIKTPKLTKGGEYILALTSVQDKRGCRSFLEEQMKISVRRQRPRGAFGLIEQKSAVMAVKDTPMRLPLRLQGEAPWTVSYRNLNGSGEIIKEKINSANGNLMVKSRGVYQLVEVADDQCPGTVESSASEFSVDWFPQPEMSVVGGESVTKATGGVFVKQEVCEGDIDGFELTLEGSPPYHVEYLLEHKSPQGVRSRSDKQFDAASAKAAISMDTSKAGDYTYKFKGLADSLYNLDRSSDPLTVQQRVNAKPTATFSKPGQAFKFCVQEQEHEDTIPITLSGSPPFYVEVEIKHQSSSTPETYHIPSINSKSFGMPIPRKHLRLGSQQLRIRKVRDARGCQQKYEIGGPAIQIQLFDAPSIYPLESREHFCVGERIEYTLSGTPPFDITYQFNGKWNAKSQTTNFRRVAEKAGEFVITSVSDKASECRAAVSLAKTIHPMPSVQISRGKQSRVDIHEGNEVDILFEFWGTPPFEFTYTRSSNAKKGQRSTVLETKHDVSYESSKVIKATQEGTYEVVAIKDKFCSFSTQQTSKRDRK